MRVYHVGDRIVCQNAAGRSRRGWKPNAVIGAVGRPRRFQARQSFRGHNLRGADAVRPTLWTEADPEFIAHDVENFFIGVRNFPRRWVWRIGWIVNFARS